MASNPSVVMKIVSSAVSISRRAGVIIRDIMKQGDLGIVEKTGKNDLQTEADRSAQKCIVASLVRQFPGIAIVGEEGEPDPNEVVNEEWIETKQDEDVLSKKCPVDFENAKESDIVVWVDPLDGTAEYTQGLLDHVTVLIGVAFRGKAVGGVIYQPYFNYQNPESALGRVIWGVIGVGSYGFNRVLPPEGENIITTTRSHSMPTVVDSVEACKPTSVMKAGGCGHKVLLVLEGKAHAYVFGSPGCKKWDTCAPEAVLHASGGKLTDIHGNYLKYHKDVQMKNSAGVLATLDSSKHQWYVDQIPESVKEQLPEIAK